MSERPQQEKEKSRSELRLSEVESAPEVESRAEVTAKATGILPDFGDNFEVLERIGQGGMGSVYKARDRSTGGIVAIKVLQEALARDATALKRFEQEADSASQLNHANLATVYGHGTSADGAPYIVMGYIDGHGLAEVLKNEHHLEPRRALNIFLEICEGLKYAHDRGVIHRDIKPTNVIMTRTADGADSAHIVDFGIAKAAPTENRDAHDLTQTGEIFGSPHYMSPEQCLGLQIDNRSDIYSLGCLMYETLIGSPPFQGANPVQLVVKHINEDAPTFPRDRKGDKILEKLENVVLRCLEKDRSLRYQSMEEVQKDLQAIKQGRQITPYRRSAKPKPAFTKGQMLGVLIVFIGISIYFCILTGTVASPQTTQIAGIILPFLCGAGMYSFYSAAFEEYRKNKAAGLAERSAWQFVLLVGLGTCCTTFIPISFAILLSLNSSNGWFWDYAVIWHAFTALFTAFSVICYFLFKSPRKAHFGLIAVKYLGVVAVISSLFYFIMPAQTEKVTMSLGRTAAKLDYSEVAKLLYSVSATLDKNDQEPLMEMAHIAALKNDSKAELQYVNLALLRAMNLSSRWYDPMQVYFLYERRARIYENLGRLDKALEDYDRIVKDNPSNGIQRMARADLLVKLKNYSGALADLQYVLDGRRNQRVLVSDEAKLYEQLARVHCYLSSFPAALNDFNAALDEPNTQNRIQLRLKRAILLEQVSGISSASKEYDYIARFANADSFDEAVCKAYADYKLGRTDEYKKLCEKFSPEWIKNRLPDLIDLPNVKAPVW